MYRDGLGVERDLKKANMLFHAAAQQDLAEAQVNLGKFHFGKKRKKALHAMRKADQIDSLYFLCAENRHGRLCARQHVF